MPKGVIIGLRNLVYALLSEDPESGTATYEEPVGIAGAISAVVNPNASNATLFADDGPYETASTIGEISLELNVADLPIDVQAVIFGHTITGGVLKRKSSDVPPWLAIGFKSLKSNGSYRYTWLAKGKFALSEQSNNTKGDSVEFQTPTASGSFVKRDCDDEWERHIDEDHVDYVASMGEDWFNDPYGGSSDTTAPTISSVAPVDSATAVAVSTSVVWTFDSALALSTVNTGNFMLIDDTGAGVDGALSLDAARKVVTFTPTDDLDASTDYTAVVTTGVTDVAGNALEAASLTTFTTTS